MNEVNTNGWRLARPGVPFERDEVIVWRVDLCGTSEDRKAAEAMVSESERARAKRFVQERDRVAFLLLRAALRLQLAAYLRVSDPREIEFAHGEYGKPRLADKLAGGIEFNTSGSGGVGLLAFAHQAEVGVDIEQHRDIEELTLAENFFAPEEAAELLALPASLRREGFFNAWTRKEAFVKAIGTGLHYPLHRFAVSLAPGAPARLCRVANDVQQRGQWSLAAIDVEPGYSAAVAAKIRRLVVKKLCGRSLSEDVLGRAARNVATR